MRHHNMNNSETVYTIGYIDYINNKFVSCDDIRPTLSLAIEDINYKILQLISENFDIHIQNKYLFSQHKTSFVENKIKINNLNSIFIVHNDGETMDVFYSHTINGYVYNSKNLIHYYKFYINKHIYHFKNKEEENEIIKSDFKFNEKKNIPIIQNDFLNELKRKIKTLKID